MKKLLSFNLGHAKVENRCDVKNTIVPGRWMKMSVVLAARERTDLRKSALNELRKEGYVPAVVYGRDEETKPIAVKKGIC